MICWWGCAPLRCSLGTAHVCGSEAFLPLLLVLSLLLATLLTCPGKQAIYIYIATAHCFAGGEGCILWVWRGVQVTLPGRSPLWTSTLQPTARESLPPTNVKQAHNNNNNNVFKNIFYIIFCIYPPNMHFFVVFFNNNND